MVSYTTQVRLPTFLILRPDASIRLGDAVILFQVASKGWFVAMVATTVETANPEAEIQPGLNLLGPIKQKFLQVSDMNYWCIVLVVVISLLYVALNQHLHKSGGCNEQVMKGVSDKVKKSSSTKSLLTHFLLLS